VNADQWDGYAEERERLSVRGMASRGGVVVLSGDVHSSWAFEGPVDDRTGEPVAVEWTTPAVSSAAMGRARYPGLWRFLDRAADSLDHVAWTDVTNRGYTIVEITRQAVRSDFWFVHPYADDPQRGAEHAAAFRTSRDEWPPRLHRVDDESSDEPARPGLPDGLPPRPADLRRIRRRRRTRITLKAGASIAVAGAALAGAAAGAWSSRRS